MVKCKKRKIYLRLIISMSLFTLLFGCKQVPIKGPNFSDAIFKIVHLSTGESVEYEMPGNMTKDFNYDQLYKKDSERTKKIDVFDESKYEADRWQSAYYIDGASWDYMADKSQGINGELGRVNFRVSVGLHDGEIQSFIRKAYDTFLNGPGGVNTEVRTVSAADGVDVEHYSSLLIEAPKVFSNKKFNEIDYLHWKLKNEHPGYTFEHFLYVLDSDRYLICTFYYKVRAKSDEEREKMNLVIQDDVSKIMSRVLIRK